MLNSKLKYSKRIIIGLSAIGLIACNGGSTATSNTPISSGIVFGNSAGLMYLNGNLLPGKARVSTIDSKQINGVVIDLFGNMYAATDAGKVYQYIVSSKSWVALSGSGAGGTLDGSSVSVLVFNNGSMYAATTSGNVFVYMNNQWNAVGTNLNSTPIQTMIFDQSNNIYVGSQNGVVYEFTDNLWLPLANGNQVDGTQVNALTINNGMLYAGTEGNTDGQVFQYDIINQTWTQINNTLSDGSVNALASNNGILYAGTQSGFVYESQSGSWVALSAAVVDGTPISLLNISNNTVYVSTSGSGSASGNGQVYSYDPVATSWNQLSTLNNGVVTALSIESGHFYAGTIDQSLNVVLGTLYSYESGAPFWSKVGGTTALDGSSIFSTTIDANGNYYAGTQLNVFKYSQATQSWLQQGNLPDQSGVSALITNNDLTYAGTYGGNIFYQVANISDWTLLGTPIQNSIITSFAVKNGGALYASTNLFVGESNSGNVLRYDISQESWIIISGTAQNSSLDNSPVQTLTIDNSNNLYAGTQGPNNNGQVWEYPESGTAWELLYGTLDNSPIQSITTDNNGILYAGTQVGQVWKYVKGWKLLGSGPLDGSGISGVTFSNGVLYVTTSGGNIWYYTPDINIWTNAFYGPGIRISPNNNTIVGSGI